MIYKELGDNLAMLVVLSVVSGYIRQRWGDRRRVVVLPGLLFGSMALVGMLYPAVLEPGLIFDGRSVIISLCGLFFGPVAVGIAAGMAVVCRICQGGVGSHMGVLVIVSSAILGIVFHYRWMHRTIEVSVWQYLGFGLLVHTAMLLLTSTLPLSMTIDVLKRISLPVMLFYPLATIIIGKVLSDQESGRRSVEALRESEKRYRNLFDRASDGIFLASSDGKLVEVNESLARMHGYSATEMLNMGLDDLDTPESRVLIPERMRRLLAGEALTLELEHYHKDGHAFPLEVSACLISSGGESVIQCFHRDITERKRAEEDKRQFYRDAIKSVTQGKLNLVSFDEVQEYLDVAEFVSSIACPADTANARHGIMEFCTLRGMRADRLELFESAVGEAMTNAIKHANGCQAYAGVRGASIWVAISDSGPGISTLTLPHALRRGFSTVSSMGMGYTIMMEASDSILLCTGSHGTTVVLSVGGAEFKRALSLDDFPDTWDDVPCVA